VRRHGGLARVIRTNTIVGTEVAEGECQPLTSPAHDQPLPAIILHPRTNKVGQQRPFGLAIGQTEVVEVCVIKTSGKSSLVCTTPYISAKMPKLGDPALLQVLYRSFFAWKNEPSITPAGLTGTTRYSSSLPGRLTLANVKDKRTVQDLERI
jgi:hypothetical protein